MIRMKVKAHRSWPVKTRELIKQAAHWACNELDIDTTKHNITIKLCGYNKDFRGDCINWAPNRHLVRMFAGYDPTRTVFHEFTHVKQHIYDGLAESGIPNVMLWRNAPYHYEEGDYWTLPWEMEAGRTEVKLSRKFADQAKNNS